MRTLLPIDIVKHGVGVMSKESDGLKWLGRYSGLAVVLSMLACYGTLALVTLLSAAGIVVSVHEGIWASFIVVFAWVAVLAMGVNLRHHRNVGPFILSDIGALLVSWVMFVDFNRNMEVSGFALLVIAALWDRMLLRRARASLPVSGPESR